tara:strand:- start:13 stop:255 length:243 start_codon:yes stop_codon:yes gene_type:complete
MPGVGAPHNTPVGAVIIDGLDKDRLRIGFDGYTHGPKADDGKAFPVEIYFLNSVPHIRIWKNRQDIGPTYTISLEENNVS